MSTSKTLPVNDHFMSLKQAEEMTTRFRANQESILAPAYKGRNHVPLSETFTHAPLDTLLAEKDYAGIRMYAGRDEILKIHAAIVGVYTSNLDILPATTMVSGDLDPVILEEGQRCPDNCPDSLPLNS